MQSSGQAFYHTPVYRLAGLLVQLSKSSSLEVDGLKNYFYHLKAKFSGCLGAE